MNDLVSTLDTAKQQQARLGEVAVWVATAHDLLEQACAAVYADNGTIPMRDVMPRDARLAVANAASAAGTAAMEISALMARD